MVGASCGSLGKSLRPAQECRGCDRSSQGDDRGAEECRREPIGECTWVTEPVSSLARGDGGRHREAERGADLIVGVDDPGSQTAPAGARGGDGVNDPG